MRTVVSVKTMRESDAATIAAGTPGKELMYRAGVGVFQSYPWRGPVAIVCGSGNNGGDGYVLATLFHKSSIPCTLFLLSQTFSEDGAYYFEQCRSLGIPYVFCEEPLDFSPYSEIVDCIFGTGFRGEVTGLAAHVIKAINQSGKAVISVDINSGLNGDNGRASLCVHSALTVSIGFYKSGHFLGDAKDVIGALCNVDIGIGLQGKSYCLMESADLSGVFGKRKQNSHKGDYGYVSILGGCAAYSGAVKLANLSCAALRAGCGVAQLIVPASLRDSVSPYLLESTLALLPEEDGHVRFDPDALDRVLARQKALAIGMGWGRSPHHSAVLRHVLQNYAIPTVIDADGLNTLAEMDRAILPKTDCSVILTPHLKEFERLSGIPLAEIQADPIRHAEEYAKQAGVILLLKGPCTVVTDGETTYLVDRGCAGMATAGSGDVLSGVLTGLLGFAPPSPLTVACGAYVAGRAGELAEQTVNPVSMTAGDTVAHIGAAVSEILKKSVSKRSSCNK